jgi:hypothetical protein
MQVVASTCLISCNTQRQFQMIWWRGIVMGDSKMKLIGVESTEGRKDERYVLYSGVSKRDE